MRPLTGLAKSLIARVLGRDTIILHDYVEIQKVCESCKIKIIRSADDPRSKRQGKWRSMWVLTLKNKDQRLFCSEACIVKMLNKQEDEDINLTASNIRSELCDNITAAPLMGFFSLLNWYNSERWGPHDF